MFEMCHVNREGYESDNKIYNQNNQKMAQALNKVELIRLTAKRHVTRTKKDVEYSWSQHARMPLDRKKFQGCCGTRMLQ